MSAVLLALKAASLVASGILFVLSSGAAFPSIGRRYRALAFVAGAFAALGGLFFLEELVGFFRTDKTISVELEPERDPALCGEFIQIKMNTLKTTLRMAHGSGLDKAAEKGDPRDLCSRLNFALQQRKDAIAMLYKCPATQEYRTYPNDEILHTRAEAINAYENDLRNEVSQPPWTAYNCSSVLQQMGVAQVVP